jgi:glycosyltransferase involved in cell wall biosynthesis
MLSVIIPSYKEPHLQRTVDDILEKSRGNIEVIVVMDGYKEKLKDDQRVRVIMLGKQHGMRNAINMGVALARGDTIMKTDAHCMFGERFDTILTHDMKDNWVVIPRRYFLDTDKWKIMDIPPVDYEKLVIHPKLDKFHGMKWKSRRGPDIDETMGFQGSCWLMKKAWFGKCNLLDADLYGQFGHESVEISMNTWKRGGRLMVNKHTWYAHQHRDFKRTHHVSTKNQRPMWAKTRALWHKLYQDKKQYFGV